MNVYLTLVLQYFLERMKKVIIGFTTVHSFFLARKYFLHKRNAFQLFFVTQSMNVRLKVNFTLDICKNFQTSLYQT